MKRVLLIALVLILVIGGTSFAAGRPKTYGLTAIGAYGSWGWTGTSSVGGIGLSLKFGSFPVIGLKYNLYGRGSIGASVDWYILDSMGLVDALTYFIGIGAFGYYQFDPAQGNIGLRGNFGLQIWPVRLIEIYLDLIPTMTFIPSIDVGLGLEVGLRFHF
jgi:hypothetical protein